MAKRNKTVTARDVAAAAGVSQSTVSMILNNYSNVSFSEETRNRVLAACVSTGYRGITTSSASPKERFILMVCPSCENLDYARNIKAIQQRSLELGYTGFILSTFRDSYVENDILRYLKTMPFAGVIFLYQPQNIYLLSQISKLYPTVTVCDRMDGMDLDAIELNSFKVGKVIANHLLELGHRHIAYIAMQINEKYITRLMRLQGIQEVYRQYGYDVEDSIKVCTFDTEKINPEKYTSEYESGFILANRALDRYDNITAIVGNNDMTCYGVISALQKRKLRVPQDYSVCGCDNVMLSGLHSLSLTTVEHYGHLRAVDAVNMLVKKIESQNVNRSEDDLPNSITRVEYEPKLVIRSSTGDAASLRRHGADKNRANQGDNSK